MKKKKSNQLNQMKREKNRNKCQQRNNELNEIIDFKQFCPNRKANSGIIINLLCRSVFDIHISIASVQTHPIYIKKSILVTN